VVLAAYLLGTFPSAVVVGRRSGFDPTAAGSQNPGATNVYRLGGRRAGAVVLGLDLAKGVIAAGAGWALAGHTVGVACGAAAVLGHCLPVTRGLRGGKGVATAAGAAIVLEPVVSIVVGLLFVAVARLGRRASLASIVAAIAMPVGVAVAGRPAVEVVLWVAVAALVVVRHRSNLARLVAGTEPALPGPDA
jgi:acyl phosphate:glycerol-3-phosphate acyltransferase